MNATVLLVEDHPAVRDSIREYLSARGCNVIEAETWRSAEHLLHSAAPDVALVDYLLPDGNALERMPRLRAAGPHVPVVILTGHGSIDLAVRAIKQGAEHFLTKPVDLGSLWTVLERLLDLARARRIEFAKREGRLRHALDPFIGTSDAIRKLEERARLVATAASPVLILGDTGSGKGVLARWVHENSPRSGEPYVDLNCAGLSRELLESELFGHEKGAFTGAVTSKQGLFETAHRGSLVLDEIGDIDPAVQPMLLKAVEDKQFRRLGEVRTRTVDVRLIAATHRDLRAAVAERKFREDLYFRISTVPLVVPPLRERSEDIPLLARELLRRIRGGPSDDSIESAAEQVLIAHPWPGNVRELRNVLERALLMNGGRRIRARDLQFDSPGTSSDLEIDRLTLDEVERLAVERALERSRGRVERAAAQLGIGRSSLYFRIKKFGIDLSRF